jgi:hypothetical protein
MTILPVETAYNLATKPAAQRWLIEELWADGAVGIVGGEPKCCKSFLALDMAVSVAAGIPCLRRYRVARRGRVLLYAAEDPLHAVRDRIDGIARASDVNLETLDLHVITAPSVRIDQERDRARLAETVATLKPVLLLLDPFVRLHRVDENVSSEVAPLLAFLRELQRKYSVAVAVVHHAKKGAGKAREGQALRGSSEFHAWGDSNLYLRRNGERLTLSIEQRAAPSGGGILLKLNGPPDAVALSVMEDQTPDPDPVPPGTTSPSDPSDHIRLVLAAAEAPVGLTALRRLCRIRTQRLTEGLNALISDGLVEKTPAGYRLRD